MWIGTLFALAAGLMWGLVFVGPLWLHDYPAVLLSFGRYLAFGLIALPLGWLDRAELRRLRRADWLEAAKLSLVGNIVYYLFLASALQRAGGPLPTMIIGTLPVVIAVVSNRRNARRDGLLPWRRLAPSLVLIGAGLLLVNRAELAHFRADPAADLGRYVLGAVLALGAVAAWTWYPVRNADWLRAHADRSPRAWATAQGLATLPLAALGYALTWAWFGLGQPDWPMPLGPGPALRRRHAGHRPAGLLAGHAVLERGQPAPAHRPGRPADRLRDPLGPGLRLCAAPAVPAERHAGRRGLLVAGVVWALRVRPVPVPA
jgi:drug/metabolite transporter (DMT)-like permease